MTPKARTPASAAASAAGGRGPESSRCRSSDRLILRRTGCGGRHRKFALDLAWQRNLAVADAPDERFGIPFRRDVELASKQRRKGLVLGQRFARAAVARIQGQCEALPVLAQRVEREQPLGRCHGFFSVGHQLRTSREDLAQPCGGELRARSLRPYPFGKPVLFDIQPGEEIAAEEICGLVEISRILRLREAFELKRVHRPEAGRQPHHAGVGGDEIGRAEVLAQGGERLTQALPRLRVGTVSPQQRRKLLAACGLVRAHRQIGDERADLSGRKPDRRRIAAACEDRPTEQTQPNTRRSCHFQSIPVQLQYNRPR